MKDDLISRKAFDASLAEAQYKCKSNGGNFRFGVLSNVRENLAKQPAVDAVPLDKLCECLVRKRIGFVDEVDGKRLTGELTKEAWATLILEWMEQYTSGMMAAAR